LLGNRLYTTSKMSKKKLCTGIELLEVIHFVSKKRTVSITEIRDKYNKNFEWVFDAMETLEELCIIDSFKGEKSREVLVYSNQAVP